MIQSPPWHAIPLYGWICRKLKHTLMGEFWVMWSRSCHCLCESWSSRESKQDKPDFILKRKARKVSAIHKGKEQKSRPMCKTQRSKLHATLAYPHLPAAVLWCRKGSQKFLPKGKLGKFELSYAQVEPTAPVGLKYSFGLWRSWDSSGRPVCSSREESYHLCYVTCTAADEPYLERLFC